MGQSSLTVIDPNQNNYARDQSANDIEDQIKRAFKQASPQGRLTKEKFNEALGIFESLQLKRLRDTPLADRLFILFDKGQEGYISEKEYLEGIRTLIADKDKRIMYSFQLIDKDKDGKITLQEFFDFIKESWVSAFRLLGEKICKGPNPYQLTQSKVNAWAQGQLNALHGIVQKVFQKYTNQQYMDISVFRQWVMSNDFGFVKAELGGDVIRREMINYIIMYCADNYISCTIIYLLNISGLILIIGLLIKNREYYFREWKRIRQVIKDYTIDYKSQGNFPIFAKYIAVLFGFAVLIIASIVSIIMWDFNFGFMEIANIFIWIICAFIFYVDYRSSFKFSKQLRITLAIILSIQVTSGIVFGIERNQEEENRGISEIKVEAGVYLCNSIIMLFINIVSVFFPNFDYQKISKNTSDDNNFISFNTLQHHLVSDDSIGSMNSDKQQKNGQKQIQQTPKKSSFLEQLDDLTSEEQKPPSVRSSSIMKLKEEQSGLIDPSYGLRREEEAIQKEKEQKELMDQIMNMHKQLDEKLNKLKPKEEKPIEQQKQQTIIKESPKVEQQQGPESIILRQVTPPQQTQQISQPRYEVSNIKIDGFQEIKKQGKRFIYFNVFYYSNSKQRQVKTEHNLKEFQQLRMSLQSIYVDHTFPEVPERKPNERLMGKEVQERAQILEKFLQFIVKHQMQSPFLDKFLEEISGPSVIQDEKTNVANIDQVLKDKTFDDFLEQRKGSIASKKSLLDLSFNDDSYDPKASIAQSAYDPSAYFTRPTVDRRQTAVQLGSDNGYKFSIKDVKIQQGTAYYKIESEINGVTGSTVLRRYNDFKDLYRKFIEKQILVPILPNEPPIKTQDVVEYRQEALSKYMNQLYQIQEVKTNLVFKEFVGI